LAAGEPDFRLGSRQLFDLRQEALQYYHRYLSLHQLKDYAGVIRDTRHNLDILQMIANHADPLEHLSSQHHRPYVLMMNTSAKVMQKLDAGAKTEALTILRSGIKHIRNVYEQVLEDNQADLAPEIYQLKELQHRITDDSMPTELPQAEKLEIELQVALLSENYEKAAALRDEIAKGTH